MEELSRFNLQGSSAVFQKTLAKIRRIATLDTTVLIRGETGTGKELAARAMHYLGRRGDKPFVPVNCGALSDSLVESELFGHERGAFTDAKQAASGLIAEADGGTLFLDEIDTLGAKAQAALLRFLQDRSYRRVGSGVLRQVDVRVLAASNADLEEMVQQRLFRQDLLYRLNVIGLTMPPLRARGDDVLELSEVMLQRYSHQYRLPLKRLHAEGRAFLLHHAWPGNVRELENLLQREFLLSEDAMLTFAEMRAGDSTSMAFTPLNNPLSSLNFKQAKAAAVAAFERDYLHAILLRAEGNLSQAARMAEQDRSAFGKLVRKYGLQSAALN